MTLEGALRAVLLADTAVSDAVDDRIVPLREGKQPQTPHISYSVEDGEDPSPTFEGASGFVHTDIEFYIVADSYDEVLELAGNLRRILDGYSGIQSGVQIVPCRYQTQSDIESGTLPGESTPVNMRSIKFKTLSTIVPTR